MHFIWFALNFVIISRMSPSSTKPFHPADQLQSIWKLKWSRQMLNIFNWKSAHCKLNTFTNGIDDNNIFVTRAKPNREHLIGINQLIGITVLTLTYRNLEKESSAFLIGEVPLLSGYELNLEKHEPKSDPQVLKEDDEVYLVFSEVFQISFYAEISLAANILLIILFFHF